MLMRGRVARLVPCTPLGIMELLQRSGIEVQGRSAVVVGDSNIVGTPLAALLRDQGAAAVTVCHRTSYKDWCGPASTQKRAQISGHLPNPLTQIPGPSFAKTNTRGKSQQQAGAHQAGHAGELESTMQAATSYAKQHLSGCQGQPDTAAHQLLPAVTKGADILVVAVGVPEMVKKEWVSVFLGPRDDDDLIAPAADNLTFLQIFCNQPFSASWSVCQCAAHCIIVWLYPIGQARSCCGRCRHQCCSTAKAC